MKLKPKTHYWPIQPRQEIAEVDEDLQTGTAAVVEMIDPKTNQPTGERRTCTIIGLRATKVLIQAVLDNGNLKTAWVPRCYVHPKPKFDEDAFKRWLAEVDEYLHDRCGLSTEDFTDPGYRNSFEAGLTPKQMAAVTCESNDLPL